MLKAPQVITFEGLVQFALPEHHAKVVDGAGVELHPEHHVSGRASVSFVVTLQLRRDVRSAQSSGRSPAHSGKLTRMSPFRRRPGSMVMQILVLLSPCTLLQESQQ